MSGCVALALLAMIAGCGGKTITRTDPGAVIDISGNWNDSDSQQMAGALVDDMVSGTPWIENHLEATSARPAIIVGPVRNRTAEHVPIKTLVGDLEKYFINSGRVKVVASSEEREGVREERADQQQFSSPETAARWGRERGADYMLVGELNSIFDREEGQEVKYYRLDAYLVDLESNEKVWVGDEEIKKYIGRGAYRP
jgi:uncharacterized protein (TIGR02722 family)